jgi:P2 family phage contractile tail tube protein
MSTKNYVPGATQNYNVYNGNVSAKNKILGVTTETTMAAIENLTETLNYAGGGGEIDMPVKGQYKSMSVEIEFTNATNSAFEIAADDATPLIFRSAVAYVDKTTSKTLYKNRTITIRGNTKKYDPGSLKVGGAGNPKVTKEVTYYKEVLDGETVTEIDKINGKAIINGVDMMKDIADLI